jgi:hypothetical protein
LNTTLICLATVLAALSHTNQRQWQSGAGR